MGDRDTALEGDRLGERFPRSGDEDEGRAEAADALRDDMITCVFVKGCCCC